MPSGSRLLLLAGGRGLPANHFLKQRLHRLTEFQAEAAGDHFVTDHSLRIQNVEGGYLPDVPLPRNRAIGSVKAEIRPELHLLHWPFLATMRDVTQPEIRAARE